MILLVYANDKFLMLEERFLKSGAKVQAGKALKIVKSVEKDRDQVRKFTIRLCLTNKSVRVWPLLPGARLPVTDRGGGWWCRLWKMASYVDR